ALYIFSLPIFGRALLALTSVPNHPSPNAQAIVLLTVGWRGTPNEYGEPTADALVLERERYAAYLAKTTGLPVAITGGVVIKNGPVLSRVTARSLESDFGVSAKWLEEKSIDTRGNAVETSEILRKAGIRQIYLVTHYWHMARSRLAFER